MIERDYMGIDGRRDHSFRVPRLDLSVTLRTPNACSDCHTDKTEDWAAEAVATWYANGRHTEPHFAQTLEQARQTPAARFDDLLGVATHADLPGVVRATALDLPAQAGSPEMAGRNQPLLTDPDPIVRAAAIPLQRFAAKNAATLRLAPLLSDPLRTVRMAAARESPGLQVSGLPPDMNRNLGSAMREWQDAVTAQADFPETQLVIAGMGLTTRQFGAALRAFDEAVSMDPQMIEAWTMMVRIHSAFGDREAARTTADAAIAANPSDVSLKLLRADLQ
ncbi:MAG: tetratricopeptide repeat protein [Rhodobacter sp.]|nr:tetratricopeptide repeat protein [Rhodobacter sp.]